MSEVMKFFLALQKYTTSPRTQYLNAAEFNHIKNYLMTCQDDLKPLKFFRDECNELVKYCNTEIFKYTFFWKEWVKHVSFL